MFRPLCAENPLPAARRVYEYLQSLFPSARKIRCLPLGASMNTCNRFPASA